MEAALLKDHEAFKKRASANVFVPSIRKNENKTDIKRKPAKRSKMEIIKKAEYNYKTADRTSQSQFAIIAKIVQFLKQRHQQGEVDHLSLDEILDEIRADDVNIRTRNSLETEALINNVKIDVISGPMFAYKPELNIRGKNGLRKILDKYAREGLGGILVETLEDSLPHYNKHLAAISDSINIISRPDKKEIIFNKVVGLPFPINEELTKLWRGISVEGMDERKIQDYLQKHNISSMDNIHRKLTITKRKSSGKRKLKPIKTHNEHMGNILEDYSQK